MELDKTVTWLPSPNMFSKCIHATAFIVLLKCILLACLYFDNFIHVYIGILYPP